MTAVLDPAEFFGAPAIQDPYPLYARLRAEGGVHRLSDSGFYLASDPREVCAPSLADS